MIRLLGGVLITGCGCWLGERQAQRIREHGTVLEALTGSLEQLRRELEFRQVPLPELFARLEQMAHPSVSRLFAGCTEEEKQGEKRLWEVWEEQVQNLPLLTREERYALTSLGAVLGRYPVREQGEAIEGVCTYLRQCREQADREYGRIGKVYRGLGAACGGILVILLL